LWLVWNDVYGFDYSSIIPTVMREPLVDCVDMKAVVTKPCAVRVSHPFTVMQVVRAYLFDIFSTST
jgi:hypothetical protein